MKTTESNQPPNSKSQSTPPFLTLRRLLKQDKRWETCDLCAIPLLGEHQHLLELENRRFLCACQSCSILFTRDANLKYRRIPREVFLLSSFRLTDSQWDELSIPIGMAFFFHSTAAGRVLAIYPSPAGPIESLLPLEAWSEVLAENAFLRSIEPDVMALLINRIGESRDYYAVPIDDCYKLVGLIRAHWRGLSGGAETWGEISNFFDGLKRRAKVISAQNTENASCVEGYDA